MPEERQILLNSLIVARSTLLYWARVVTARAACADNVSAGGEVCMARKKVSISWLILWSCCRVWGSYRVASIGGDRSGVEKNKAGKYCARSSETLPRLLI